MLRYSITVTRPPDRTSSRSPAMWHTGRQLTICDDCAFLKGLLCRQQVRSVVSLQKPASYLEHFNLIALSSLP